MKPRSLMDCKNLDQVASLRREHFERGDFGILSDGYTVWLHEQPIGQMPKQSIGIPKTVFDFLIS